MKNWAYLEKRQLLKNKLVELLGLELDSDGLWSTVGTVNLSDCGLSQLPLKFGVVGYFYCNNNQLTSLKGAPKIVRSDFYCQSNRLTSLEFFPTTVGSLDCSNNQLTSLKGIQKVKGSIDCRWNKLTNLQGLPEKIDYLFCSYNELTSLEGPKYINKLWANDNKITDLKNCPHVWASIEIYNNKITSLMGIQNVIDGDLDCSNNQLTNLEGAPEIVRGDFNCRKNKITSLQGGPRKVKYAYNCSYNLLSDLEGVWEANLLIARDNKIEITSLPAGSKIRNYTK